MKITIEKIRDNDAPQLFQFETENRLYFEKMVPGRGDEYYNYECFLKRHRELLAEQARGTSLFYLIKNDRDGIIGRVNLVDVDHAEKSGHIGYRVGEAHTGKGVAGRAIAMLLHELPQHGIRKVYAKTTVNNAASQQVLMRNGFEECQREKELFELNGEMTSFIHFVRETDHPGTGGQQQ